MNDQIKHYSDKLAYEIDSWDLKVALESGEPVIVIDTRSPEAYAAEHIPGAISLPHRTMDAATTARFDKAHLVVTYCDGIGCNASTKGALAMARLGFRVKELIGGLDWWKRDGHPTEGATPARPTAPAGAISGTASFSQNHRGNRFAAHPTSPSSGLSQELRALQRIP